MIMSLQAKKLTEYKKILHLCKSESFSNLFCEWKSDIE